MDPLLFRPSDAPRLRLDFSVLILMAALSALGIITIWGASGSEGAAPPFTGFARRQLLWAVVGLPVIAVLFFIDYRWSGRVAWILYALLLLGLVGVLLQDRPINGSESWFVIGKGKGYFRFQPSEIGKVVVVIVLARYLSGRAETFRDLRHTIIPLLIVLVPTALVLRQPDFGTAIVYLPVAIVMFFVAGVRKRVLLAYLLMGVAAAAAVYPHLKPYQRDRIQTLFDPTQDALGRGYNIIQAQTALGSGGAFGKGWGHGTQTSLRFLPEYQTDFVFPSLGEQFGLAGCALALALFAALLLRMAYVAGTAADAYGTLLVAGVTAILSVHIILNVGMAVGLLPVTGLPLPFISYGGSFMLSCCVMLGLSLSVAARREN